MANKPDTLWVMSNRVDTRTVFWDPDPIHPGDPFVAGPTPAHVARTPEVEGKLRSGELVEVPEPPDGPKKPLPVDLGAEVADRLDMPGQPTRLGRTPDPDLVPAKALPGVEKQQEAAPNTLAVPPQTVVPPAPAPERSTRRS